MKLLNKFISFISVFLLLFYQMAVPLVALAQEATPSATLDAIVEASPSATPTPTSTPLPSSTPAPVSDWLDIVDKIATTKDSVITDHLYTAPQNDKVTVKFNKLSDSPGKVTIKEVTLTDEQMVQTKALSSIAYDISSDMENGTFEYTLTLPTPKTENVEVKTSEDGQSFVTVGGVSAQADTLTITGLNHFTIFVVTGTIAQVDLVYTASTFSESPNGVVINEFVFDPSSGTEWVELYNTASSSANLTGWTLKDRDATNTDLTFPSGTIIPANGILVFENNSSGWLDNLDNNTNGDTITLRNSGDTIISQVTYQKGEGVTAVAGLASSFGDMSPGQSIGRVLSETGITWQAYATPTKGWFNDAGQVGKAPLLSTIDSSLSSASTGITSNIGELDNPSNTPSGDSGLYFEKTGKGKILFTASLNLTNQATIAVLQSLGQKMEMTDGHIKFDSQTATDMATTGAKIYMYGLNDFNATPNLIVKNDTGTVIDSTDTVNYPDIVKSWDNTTKTLSFTTSHFTQFDVAPNIPPSFDAIASPVIDEDSVTQNVAITNVSPGTNETSQSVTLTASSSNISVIPNPTISGSGATQTLSYAPVANANGTATITVTANDGQSLNNTFSRTFTITVNPVNDTPSFTKGNDQNVSEDGAAQTASSWATSISVGPVNESDQTLSFNVTNNNNSLFSVQPTVAANGTLTYTPAANANGSATVTVSLSDSGGATSATQTFTITVNTVNDTPTITLASPNGGEKWSGTHNVTWSATDVDNDPLAIEIQYSANSGVGWTNIAFPGNTGSYGVDTTALIDGNQYLVRVKATDGTATVQDDSNANFTVDNTAPSITYNYPTIGGQTVWYNSDPGNIINVDFIWGGGSPLDSAQRKIGSGSFVNIFTADQSSNYITNWDIPWASLAEGLNQISLKVADTAGNMRTDNYLADVSGFLFRKDTVAPNTPVIATPIQRVKTNTIQIIGTSEADSTVTITGGASTASGTATGGNYDITVTLTSNVVNNLSVTAKDVATNGSSAATVAITHDNVAPTVTKLGDNSTDYVLSAGNINLVFSEVLSDSSKTAVTNGLTAGADKTLTYTWSGATLTITASETTTFANDVVVSVSDVAENSATGLLLVDSKLDTTQTTPDNSGDATVNSTTPQVVITNPTQAVDVTISSGTTDPTIDVSSFISGGTGTLPAITITSANANNANVAIPASTVVTSADTSWNGVIAAPTVTTVTLPETSGETKTLSTAIEVGFTGAKLSFDKAVRILLTNQAGKRAGYVRTGTAFTEITNTCSADNQATGDVLAADGDCKIDVGLDLVIWTKHFTKFASYTQTTNSSSSSSSSGGGLSAASAPTCGDQKPGSAPTLISAVAGTNSVVLTWNKASDPVTYYLVNYSRTLGKFEYGNPNVGGKNTTSYTVSGLSGGTTYYFKVRAGNECAPGDYSNEISATPGGGIVSEPAAGFTPGILGVQTQAPQVQGVQTSEQQPQAQSQTGQQANSGNFFGNIFSAIFGFIARLFGR